MELKEKEELFWENANRRKFEFPVRTFYLVSYRDMLKDADVKILFFDDNPYSSLADVLKITRQSQDHVAVYHQSGWGQGLTDEGIYVFKEGLPRALISCESTPGYADFLKKHAVLEFGEKRYELADKIFSIALKEAEIPLIVKQV